MIGCFFLFILYGSSIRSLSLAATLHLLSFEPVTFFMLHECSPPAHPPSYSYVPLICSCLSIAWYCLCFHLFPGSGEAYMDRYDASDALSSVTGQETVQALGRAPETSTVEPALPPATFTTPTSPARESTPPQF